MVSLEEIYDFLKENKGTEYSAKQLSEAFDCSVQNILNKLNIIRKKKVKFRRIVISRRIETYGGERAYLVLVHKYE